VTEPLTGVSPIMPLTSARNPFSLSNATLPWAASALKSSTAL